MNPRGYPEDVQMDVNVEQLRDVVARLKRVHGQVSRSSPPGYVNARSKATRVPGR